jgi:hypothetical protein
MHRSILLMLLNRFGSTTSVPPAVIAAQWPKQIQLQNSIVSWFSSPSTTVTMNGPTGGVTVGHLLAPIAAAIRILVPTHLCVDEILVETAHVAFSSA